MEINQLLSDGTSPRAEYDSARMILMHEPGMELYDGVIHPSAALYEHYFDVDAAAAEHRGYQEMLRKNGIKVITVKEILMNTDITALRQMVENVLIYDATNTSFDLKEVDAELAGESPMYADTEFVEADGFQVVPDNQVDA